MTHDEPEIEATGMNQEAFQNVCVTAQMGTAHAPGVIEMGERALDHLATSTHQAAAPSSPNPPAVAIHRRLGSRLLRPVASTPGRLRHVGANADGVEVHHRLITVIALVRDDLVQRLRLVDLGLRRFDLLGGGRHRFDDRRRVALVSALQRDRDNRARLEVHGMLGFVGQMRPTIFHLRDLRIRIVRVRPLLIRRLLLPLAIQPRQVLTCRRLDTRGLREPCQKLVIGFLRVPPYDAAHRGVGFQSGRVDRDGLALQEPDLDQPLLHPGEYRPMRLHVDQAPGPRNGRVIGGRLMERQAHEATDRQGVGRPPRDAALRVDPFEVPDEQQPEILARRQTRPSHDLGIELATLVFRESVEPVRVQDRVQSRIKRVPWRRRQVRRGDPQRGLVSFSRTHRHVRHCSTATPITAATDSPAVIDFHPGLLSCSQASDSSPSAS